MVLIESVEWSADDLPDRTVAVRRGDHYYINAVRQRGEADSGGSPGVKCSYTLCRKDFDIGRSCAGDGGGIALDLKPDSVGAGSVDAALVIVYHE